MGRPYVLVEEKTLKKLYKKHMMGVKYRTLIRLHELNIAPGTLIKLLDCYDEMQATDQETKKRIRNSLFPEWLVENVQSQNPSEWIYDGKFPLGQWLVNPKL